MIRSEQSSWDTLKSNGKFSSLFILLLLLRVAFLYIHMYVCMYFFILLFLPDKTERNGNENGIQALKRRKVQFAFWLTGRQLWRTFACCSRQTIAALLYPACFKKLTYTIKELVGLLISTCRGFITKIKLIFKLYFLNVQGIWKSISLVDSSFACFCFAASGSGKFN